MLGDAFRRIEILAKPSERQADAQLMLFEPTQDGQPAYVEAEIDLDMVLVQKVNFSKSIIDDFESQIVHPPAPEGLKIVDDRGREIEHVIISTQKAYYTHYQDENLPEVYKVNRFRVGMLLPDYSYGLHLLNIVRSEKTRPVSKGAGDPGIGNEFYGISFENGSFTVLDKRTGRMHKGVHRLIDKGDAGDEYTYSWPQNDREYSLDASLIRVKTEHVGALCRRLIVEGSLRLPERLSEDRKSRSEQLAVSPVRITVSLYKGIDRIDFKTELENNSDDHRLQTEFPSGIHTQRSSSGGTFGITERNIAPQIPEHWMEYPQSTHPTHGFMELSDGKYGLAAASYGLTEFEAAEYGGQTVLRITLLRCVGWLSRTDLFTRKGNGGWTIATPGAQCRGRHVFEYCIAYHAQDYRHGSTYGLLEKMLHPTALYQMRKSGNNRRFVSNPLGFISQLQRDVRLSTAKISENGSSVILRVYSIAEKDRKVRLRLPAGFKVALITNMAEERQSKMEISGGLLSLVIEPAQIITLELVYVMKRK